MISVEDIRRLEKLSNQMGVSNSMLMDRAGKSLYHYISTHYDLKKKTPVIFAGSGNNAGDGFSLARLLSKDTFVFVFMFGNTDKFSGETAQMYGRLLGNPKVEVLEGDELNEDNYKRIKKQDDLLLIDALFGIGFKDEMPREFTQAVDWFNSMRGIKLSVDVPSGVDATSGKHAAFHCRPDKTLTFFDKKPGLMGTKNVVVIDLAFAPDAVQRVRQEISKRGPLSK